MANAWGELSYGLGEWGLQNDVIVNSIGTASSVSVNSIDYVGEPNGWGQFTWGFGEWGDLINPNVDVTGIQLNTFVGNEEAFADIVVTVDTNLLNVYLSSPAIIIGVLIIPDSFELNSTVNSVFAGENVIVEVTTPGSPTQWGVDHWGYANWGQITGLIAQESEEEVGIQTNVALAATELATVTLGPNYEILIGILEEPTGVLSSVNINSVFAGEVVTVEVSTNVLNISLGDEAITGDANIPVYIESMLAYADAGSVITGDANLILNSLLLNVSTGTVDHIIDVAVDVTTPGSPTTWGNYAWGQQAWGRIVGLEIDQGAEEVVVPSIEVDVIGQQLNTTIGIYSITANANVNASTNTALNISLGDETGLPNTIVNLTSLLLDVVEGTASGQAVNIVSVTGVSATISTGRLYVSAWAVVDIGVTNTWSVVDIAA